MKIKVLKEVPAGDATQHSHSDADNSYFATLNGLDSIYVGHVVEVYRDPNTPLDNPTYLNVAEDIEIHSFSIITLRQLISIDLPSIG